MLGSGGPIIAVLALMSLLYFQLTKRWSTS